MADGSQHPRRITFWFDYASTYSYLTAMRIEAMAAKHGVAVDWQPFLLGPIFRSQGWVSSPFNVYPAKGRHMIRDLERLAERRKLIFRMPEPFPQNSLLAARLGIVGRHEGWIADFSKAVFSAQFSAGCQISDPDAMRQILRQLGVDPVGILALAQSDGIKQELRLATERAATLGIFGAPSFVLENGELYWGDDRLEQAIEDAAHA